MKDGKVVVRGRSVESFVLEPSFADAFAAGPLLLRFTRGPGGQPTGFDLTSGGMKTIRFERK